MNKENDKYFIPDIEDIRVGYEYIATWIADTPDVDDTHSMNCVFGTDSPQSLHGLMEMILQKRIYTPFLTKEQIEQEGWKAMNAPITTIHSEFLDIPFEKNNYRLDYNYETHMISLGDDLYYPMYRGECKSINELRYITKLLKI